jgi:hypothetical protein
LCKCQLFCSCLGNNHYVEGWNDVFPVSPKKFSQQSLDSIAGYSIAEAPRGSDTKAWVRVLRWGGDQQKVGAMFAFPMLLKQKELSPYQ